ncbi:hypothetical protein [Thorsellia anophelis]|uniref:Uncharacterized protein n=1 Tax=Thorsellia anophelis DSM 18579 TaxID=1123402 RepID=A0A1I0CWB2_9GAMM|nr:hypothetical protein [Thorsellia anophelis]SET23940.1 hypothetical protein SAMN02583745_01769 [Thorsellia anophelis DSM 18579]
MSKTTFQYVKPTTSATGKQSPKDIDDNNFDIDSFVNTDFSTRANLNDISDLHNSVSENSDKDGI